MYAKKSVSMKVVVLLLAVVLLIGCVAGGTLAWLYTSTDPVTNTFIAGEIGTLKLEETDKTSQNDNGKYIIVPGADIKKDPVITYTPATDAKANVSAYIFVEVSNATGSTGTWILGSDKKTFTADELSWVIADGWTHLSGNVFYQMAGDSAVTAHVIKDDRISVASSIVKGDDMTDAVNAASGLTFTAYAIQQDTFADAAAAWTALQDSNP